MKIKTPVRRVGATIADAVNETIATGAMWKIGGAHWSLDTVFGHLDDIAAAVNAQAAVEAGCVWTLRDTDANAWETECGESWALEEGSLAENGLRFCPFCGRRVKEKTP